MCGFDLRLWLWSVDILKYFLGTPSPKLPIRTDVIFKNENSELRCGAETLLQSPGEGPAAQVRMVSSTCSQESAWPASFFSDRRLHSVSTSKLATSRILETA